MRTSTLGIMSTHSIERLPAFTVTVRLVVAELAVEPAEAETNRSEEEAAAVDSREAAVKSATGNNARQPPSYSSPMPRFGPVRLSYARRTRVGSLAEYGGHPYDVRPLYGSRAKAAQAPRIYAPKAACSGVSGRTEVGVVLKRTGT